jgi:hypothetical protein
MKRRRRVDAEPGRRQERVPAAEAKADDADLSRALRHRSQRRDLIANVVDDLLDVDPLGARERSREPLSGPLHHSGFDVSTELIRYRHHETAGRIVIGELANHRLDPEHGRQQEDRRRFPAGGQRNVGLAHGALFARTTPANLSAWPHAEEAIGVHRVRAARGGHDGHAMKRIAQIAIATLALIAAGLVRTQAQVPQPAPPGPVTPAPIPPAGSSPMPGMTPAPNPSPSGSPSP